jgi:hypothetical protein
MPAEPKFDFVMVNDALHDMAHPETVRAPIPSLSLPRRRRGPAAAQSGRMHLCLPPLLLSNRSIRGAAAVGCRWPHIARSLPHDHDSHLLVSRTQH